MSIRWEPWTMWIPEVSSFLRLVQVVAPLRVSTSLVVERNAHSDRLSIPSISPSSWWSTWSASPSPLGRTDRQKQELTLSSITINVDIFVDNIINSGKSHKWSSFFKSSTLRTKMNNKWYIAGNETSDRARWNYQMRCQLQEVNADVDDDQRFLSSPDPKP